MSSSGHDDVTVVVTNFNYGRFLPEAVTSALEQAGGAPRVIVVDDGSTEPETETVLAGLPHAVEVVRQANTGIARARNAGFSRACTPYLLTLDADDRLAPDALDRLKPPLDADRRLGFTYGVMRYFGDWEGRLELPPYDPYKLLYRHMIGATALLRREVFEATGGFDPEFGGFEDWEFWLHALEQGWRGERVDAETLHYRKHGPSRSIARARYRTWWRLLRERRAPVYGRSGALARETAASPLTRLVYRWYWGPRPIPARLEQALYRRLWRPGADHSSTRRPS